MTLESVIEWGVSKKFDKFWRCNGCWLKLTEKGVTE